jgi:hypothetical protein
MEFYNCEITQITTVKLNFNRTFIKEMKQNLCSFEP